jgi:predicted RNA-binding protein
MSYYLDLFSPATYVAFSKSDRTISGFRPRQRSVAQRIKRGDRFVCYMTKLARWVGILEVQSGPFEDSTPIFYPESDPFTVRFRVNPIHWLPLDRCVPIHEDEVWEHLSFTRGQRKDTSNWTGKLRGSLVQLSPEDGQFLERLLAGQVVDGRSWPVHEDEFQRLLTTRVRGATKDIAVTVPTESEPEPESSVPPPDIRESIRMQALLAEIGTRMGMQIWIPRNDRQAVLGEWRGDHAPPLERLPLNYDDVTLRTIEQIDVLWLKGRAIKRAFEVEHTTSIYSGILRMADLLALQPNMDIRLHIVAPDPRREKVFHELRRPVFSLLDRGLYRKAVPFCPTTVSGSWPRSRISRISRTRSSTSTRKMRKSRPMPKQRVEPTGLSFVANHNCPAPAVRAQGVRPTERHHWFSTRLRPAVLGAFRFCGEPGAGSGIPFP